MYDTYLHIMLSYTFYNYVICLEHCLAYGECHGRATKIFFLSYVEFDLKNNFHLQYLFQLRKIFWMLLM